jgi:hypothetical protein
MASVKDMSGARDRAQPAESERVLVGHLKLRRLLAHRNG